MNYQKLPRLDNRSNEELIFNILLQCALEKKYDDSILESIINSLNLGETIHMSDFAININNIIVVFEYDSGYWHLDKIDNDIKKTNKILSYKNNIELFRIRVKCDNNFIFKDNRCHIENFDTSDMVLIVNTILNKLKTLYNINNFMSINKKHIKNAEEIYIKLKCKIDKKYKEYYNEIINI